MINIRNLFNRAARSMTLWALLVCLFAPVSAYSESECDWNRMPCVDVKDIKTEIKTLRKGEATYTLDANTEEYKNLVMMYGTDCSKGDCRCEEDLRYMELQAEGEHIAQINEQLKKEALTHKCSVHSIFARVLPIVIYARPSVVSLAHHLIEYPRGGNGSCHGSDEVMAFDIRTGKQLFLKDVADVSNHQALYDALIDKPIRAAIGHGKSYKEHKARLQPANMYSFGDEPIFIEQGRIRVNTGPRLGCAGGDFHPVTVPSKFIRPEFLALLKEQN